VWKPAEFSSAERMAMALEITELLRRRYGDSLVGVLLEGSTAKGTDRTVSDLEFTVVLDECEDRWSPFFRRGMFVGISYRSVAAATAGAEKIGPSWPVAGDTLETGVALYDPGGLFERLRRKNADAVEKADFGLLVRDALADVYENVLKLFSLRPEEALQAGVFAGGAAFLAALAVGLANKHRYLSARLALEESFALPSLPRGYREAITELLASGNDVTALRGALSRLWPALTEWAAGMGVCLDDEGAEI